MFLVQGNLFIIKLKTLLHCNTFYICLFTFLVIYILFRLFIDSNESIYDINDTSFNMIVSSYQFSEDKLSLMLDGKEDLVGTYYIKNDKELNYLKKNIKYGVNVKVDGSLELLSNNTVPSAFNYKKYLNNKGIYYRLVIDNIIVIDSNIGIVYYFKNIIK